MTRIIAVFSNGHTDEYQGQRNVTAAWMVTEKETGKVIASGHSLCRIRAAKTGRSAIPRIADLMPGWRDGRTPGMYKHFQSLGYHTPEEYEASIKAKNAEHAALYTLEVVDL